MKIKREKKIVKSTVTIANNQGKNTKCQGGGSKDADLLACVET